MATLLIVAWLVPLVAIGSRVGEAVRRRHLISDGPAPVRRPTQRPGAVVPMAAPPGMRSDGCLLNRRDLTSTVRGQDHARG